MVADVEPMAVTFQRFWPLSVLDTTCTLEVRKSNAHAQSLYKALGFHVKGERKNVYQNPEEDAVLMEKKL